MSYKKIFHKNLKIIPSILIVIVATLFLVYSDYQSLKKVNYDIEKTNKYLETVSWKRYLDHTQSLMEQPRETSIKYSDPDYPGLVNLGLIKQKESELQSISREKVLKKLYQEIAKQNSSEDEVLQNLINKLQTVIYHDPKIQPLYKDGTIIADPLVLLEMGLGRCGHSARLAVDLFLANGYQARYIQAASHIEAEVYWQGEWKFLPVNSISRKDIIQTFGYWPSFEDLLLNPYLIDQYTPMSWENLLIGGTHTFNFLNYNSFYLFGNTTSEDQLGYWSKATPKHKWQNSKYYGWESLNKQTYLREKSAKIYLPKIPILKIDSQSNQQILSVSEPQDPDNDFWQYEICIYDKSRNWEYGQSSIDINKTTQLINCNIATEYSQGEPVEINLNPGKYFVSVYAKDKRAIEDPKIFYPPSQEYSFEVL